MVFLFQLNGTADRLSKYDPCPSVWIRGSFVSTHKRRQARKEYAIEAPIIPSILSVIEAMCRFSALLARE